VRGGYGDQRYEDRRYDSRGGYGGQRDSSGWKGLADKALRAADEVFAPQENRRRGRQAQGGRRTDFSYGPESNIGGGLSQMRDKYY